jgi:hypothetical protein
LRKFLLTEEMKTKKTVFKEKVFDNSAVSEFVSYELLEIKVFGVSMFSGQHALSMSPIIYFHD